MTGHSIPYSRILTVGTGAIGAYYTWRMQQAGNCTVTTVCRSNYEAVKAKGIEIQTTAWGEGPHVFQPDRVVKTVPSETFDYILVCMKALPDVYSIADIIAPAVEASPDAAIVLIQNGIGVEDPVKKRFPRNPILSSIAYIGVTQNTAGVVFHSGPVQRLVVGLFEPIEGIDTAKCLKEFGERCKLGGLETVVSDDIQNYRWQKLVWNGSMNPVCILSDLWTVSNVLADEKYKAMARQTMTEIAALAEALGHPMPPTLVEVSMTTSARLADGYKASMVVDLEEGRPLETEVILHNPIRIAEERNLTHVIPTWYKLYYDLVKYLDERKASGKL
ncbi:2-dehydropantoate 2-reductase [Entomortierella parvispora]|uniref:2-dehydropantoate 2-reductase n=1 Tax=Entomortierella parvispora TaxID=205924 RepID=A0A9P3M1X2_9FUNG|nr:2-dehydropantoate 2-reductase [Entomortierella parvispora]